MTPRPGTRLIQKQKLRLTQRLTASIRILRFDASGLTRYLEEQAAENPALRLAPPPVAPGEWLPRWGSVLARLRGGGTDLAEGTAAAGPSLVAHVVAALDRLFPDGRARAQAMVFVQALEPSGWLGAPLPRLAAEAGLTLPEAEAMLRRLQMIEPAGLFARSLRECLELQAREAGCLDAAMAAVLANLDRVAAGDLAAVASRGRIPEAAVAAALRRLRGFNPKPGTQFEPGAAPVREPDLLATRGPGGWTVALNRGALPTVEVAPGRGPGQRAAREVARLVEARGAILLRIGAEVLRRQARMAEHGPEELVPMTMAEVAGALGVAVSTVSRGVAGTSLELPRGTVWLRALFAGGVGEGEDAASAAALRARIAAAVAAEDPSAPLSDAALAALVAEGGPEPARRTVAKYRAMLHIPPAHARRRRG